MLFNSLLKSSAWWRMRLMLVTELRILMRNLKSMPDIVHTTPYFKYNPLKMLLTSDCALRKWRVPPCELAANDVIEFHMLIVSLWYKQLQQTGTEFICHCHIPARNEFSALRMLYRVWKQFFLNHWACWPKISIICAECALGNHLVISLLFADNAYTCME